MYDAATWYADGGEFLHILRTAAAAAASTLHSTLCGAVAAGPLQGTPSSKEGRKEERCHLPLPNSSFLEF